MLEVGSEETDQRLDRFLRRRFPHLTQGAIEKMCRKGDIRVEGVKCKSNTRVLEGQSVRMPPLPSHTFKQAPKAPISEADRRMMQSLVLYKDNDIIVINKPHGLAVQGGSKTTKHIDGLSEALCFDRDTKPLLVHRLDRDTSGVLVMGRHPQAAARLAKLFQSKYIEKVYWALVAGVPSRREGRIRFGLVKARHGEEGMGEKMHPIHPNEVDETRGAKHATTDYMVLEVAGQRLCWLAMSPQTGRTHQLRAHSSALGHPIIGDGKYGGSGVENKGDGWGAGIGGEMSKNMHLHARMLRFEHPMTGREVEFKAPLPKHMQQSWDVFGWKGNAEYDQMWDEARSQMK